MASTNIGSYGAFLTFLLTIGPKLQALWPKVEAFIACTQDLIEAVRDLFPAPTPVAEPGTLAVFNLTPEESELELRVASEIAGPNAAFDGHILRNAWKFFQAHPGLLAEILSILKEVMP